MVNRNLFLAGSAAAAIESDKPRHAVRRAWRRDTP
jgi:hypothetical protein